VFTFGGISGQVDSAEAQKQQAQLVYQLTILNAFRETNDALTGAEKKASEVAEQQKRVDALREFARLSNLRFEKGVTGYLDVLIAENELFSAELAAVRLRADRDTQVINVYRAMGGGWVDISNSMATNPENAVAVQGAAGTPNTASN
jgi:multidrug efflux system outer membrane protein